MLDYWDEDGNLLTDEELHKWHEKDAPDQDFEDWLDDQLMSGQLTADPPDTED